MIDAKQALEKTYEKNNKSYREAVKKCENAIMEVIDDEKSVSEFCEVDLSEFPSYIVEKTIDYLKKLGYDVREEGNSLKIGWSIGTVMQLLREEIENREINLS